MCGQKTAHLFARMIVFNTDLDNTIIYSYKHDIGPEKRGVEQYQGRTISYVTEKTYQLLNEVRKKVEIVPTTTRTIEQYKRIDLGVGAFRYALVCNGGVLLVDGIEDENWYQESLLLVEPSKADLLSGIAFLQQDENVNFEIRFIKDLFVFTKSSEPEKTVAFLREKLNRALVDVFHNGTKVYIVPVLLNKGRALERLQNRMGTECVIAAGDSEFDISMLEKADFAIAPEELPVNREEQITWVNEQEIFSEKVLETVNKIALCFRKG